MATIDELLEVEKQNKEREDKRKEWLKEKNIFFLIGCQDFYNDKDLFGKNENVFVTIEDIKEQIENTGRTEFNIKKAVYRTNKWKESLPEIEV